MNRFKSHWVQVLQNLWPVCFFLPHFLQFEKLIHGISQSNRSNPHFVKIEILRHFSVCPTLKIFRIPGIAWSTSWWAQKLSLSWRLLSHHALKDFVSPVSTTHQYQDYLTSLIWPSNLGCTNQYSLIAKCMTASNVSDLDLHSPLTKTDLNFH